MLSPTVFIMRLIKTYLLCLTIIFLQNISLSECSAKRALQKSHEKSISEKRMDIFFRDRQESYQELSLVALINEVGKRYLAGCTSIMLYDNFTEFNDRMLLESLFKTYPISFLHGQITNDYKIVAKELLTKMETCVSYILFLKDVMRCQELIGEQSFNKVVVIARSSQWRVYEFLANKLSQSSVNLLVIAQTARPAYGEEAAYILFTHKLFTDALGSSSHQVLTSWKHGRFTRPNVTLFPNKATRGFNGYRIITAVAAQPPFVIQKNIDENDDIEWEGIEVRLLKLLSVMYNFSLEFKTASSVGSLGTAEAVTNVVQKREAHLGISGLYITQKRLDAIEHSVMHSQDCAAFISLTSTALPRYRAIMGPFQWTVWLALVIVYVLAIFPIAFSDKHTLKPLLRNPEEIENMFWYVFGTFTNAFSFTSKKSWSQSHKMATRLFIGFYWLFTIIITACYTGSIIAFVTLPIFPSTIDTATQLLSGRYRIGTLDKGGWQYWFENSSDPVTTKLLKNVDLVPTVEEGLRNTTKAFFWSYAFLGSRAQLDYIVRTNFTTKSKRSILHIGEECFVPFSVSLAYQKNAIYARILDKGILKIVQSGFMIKIKNDIEFLMMRSATGKLLAASSGSGIKALSYEDRALTLDDTQGMFLLLAAGFLMGGASLASEIFGGCFGFCKTKRSDSTSSIASNPRSYDTATPREKINSIQYNYSILNQMKRGENTDAVINHMTGQLTSSRGSYDFSIQRSSIPEENRLEELTVHAEDKDTTNYDEEIDKIFDFAHIFGEDTSQNIEGSTSREKIIDDDTDEEHDLR